MKVVVTGGAGFIGSYVCHALCARGMQVTAYDNLSTGHPTNLKGTTAELIEGDVCNELALERAVAGADAVVHLAAVSSVPASLAVPQVVYGVNTTGTFNVLQAARRTGAGKHGAHVVFTSSAAVYGQQHQALLTEDLPTRPISPYGASKAAAEMYVHAFSHVYELPVLTLRLFNVYGPGQRALGGTNAPVVPSFMLAATMRDVPLYLHGDGQQARSFVYAGYVAAVIADAVQRRVSSPIPVNIGSLGGTTIAHLAELVGEITDYRIVEQVPARPGDIHGSIAEVSRQLHLFPDLPMVEPRSGLQATWSWWQNMTCTPTTALTGGPL